MAVQDQLARLLKIPVNTITEQDWAGAERIASTAGIALRELAWPHAVLGYAAERRGNLDGAIQHYAAAVPCLGTSGGFTSAWCEPPKPGSHKFAAQRLVELAEQGMHLPEEIRAYVAACQQREVHAYWVERGTEAEASGRDAYWDYYRSGWDAFTMDYTHDALEQLLRTARTAGSSALAALAERHLAQCLR